MSRIGKQKIIIPSGVTVTVTSGELKVVGPKGTLIKNIHPAVSISMIDNTVAVTVAKPDEKDQRALWGTFGSHVKNMIQGVTKGYERKLEINGVGYKAALVGKDLKLEVGFSHSVMFQIPEGITASVEKNVITLVGFDKELVGKMASELRAVKKPEPYKGKGIKYLEEILRKKAGKTAKA